MIRYILIPKQQLVLLFADDTNKKYVLLLSCNQNEAHRANLNLSNLLTFEFCNYKLSF